MKLKKKLNCILLIDDDSDDNEYHEIILRKLAITDKIDIAINGVEAIKYLKTKDRVPPELIFLDMNILRKPMKLKKSPGMKVNHWTRT